MMRPKLTLCVTLFLAVALGSLAVAGSYGGTIQMYLVNFTWKTAEGQPVYPTFASPTGSTTAYEPFSVTAGFATCLEVGASTLNGTDQIVWYQQAGNWFKLADDVSGRDPHAVVYSDGSLALELRIADYYAGSNGFMQVRTQYVQPMTGSYETRCDDWANYRKWPYLKVKNGVITVANAF